MLTDPSRPSRPTRLVLFHGLASTPREFGFLTHPLRRHGLRLQAPEVPGYSNGLHGDGSLWQDWVESAGRCVAALSAESSEPFVVGGLCTGALLAVALAADRPLPGLRGIALLSPLFAYDGWSLPRWYSLRRVAYFTGLTRFFSMAERPPYGLKNDRMRQWMRQQMATGEPTMVGPSTVPLRIVRESERLSSHVVPLLSSLQIPLQVQHARDDEICSLASARAALSNVAPDFLNLQILDNSYHMITADNDRYLVADNLSAFMQGLPVSASADPAHPDSPSISFSPAQVAIAS